MSFDQRIFRDPATGFVLDLSRSPVHNPECWDEPIKQMCALEAGGIANQDEDRMVGHYWLRAPERSPSPQLQSVIETSWTALNQLDLGEHTDVVLIGIGGSALGPQFLRDALHSPQDSAQLHFIDNTDPEGFHRTLQDLDPHRTLSVVVSKSGGTVETRNAMLAATQWYRAAGTSIAEHGVAITGPSSLLADHASGWRATLPVWDWVGGRTSITSPVGLAPMVLCGWNWREFLSGAAHMDSLTRAPFPENPAAQLADAWFAAGDGVGTRALVIQPYRDRLALLGRYLQQLVMESLGKRLDRAGQTVHQGLSVYGNKGSTDQHAFIQQVRDGRDDAFVHFVETTSQGPPTPAADGFDAADHLLGFMLGTRAALDEASRPSVSIRVPDITEHSLGMLIALFERTVGLYAEKINLNAYHQPGVEAGKRGAKASLRALTALMQALTDDAQTAEALASSCECAPATAWRLLTHLAATGRASHIRGDRPSQDRFRRV